jgi:formamidopyrimidine-DNA glycosylase
MPELPELEVVQEVLNRRIVGQTITAAEGIPPGAAIVIRDLTGEGFGAVLAGATFESIVRRGKFLVFTLAAGDQPQAERAATTVRAEGAEGRAVLLIVLTYTRLRRILGRNG